MPIVRASYTKNYFSEQYHKHEFTAGLEEACPQGSDVSSIHAALTAQCIAMVESEVAKLPAKTRAAKGLQATADQVF